MSTSRGSGGGNGVQPIPAGSRKMVQSLKEIVNCSETEIYAVLRDCNMDPNEAVNRLLSQDPFHEVKSKREKRKEGKEPSESRSRGANNSSNRGGKGGADRYLSRGGSTLYNSSASAKVHGKPTYKKENGSAPYSSSLSSAPGVSGSSRSSGAAGLSDGASAENKWLLGTADRMPFVAQPSSVSHSAWVGVPGQMSMAEIVKRGRPHKEASNAMTTSHNDAHTSHHSIRSPDDYDSKFHESGVSSVQHVPVNDEWPSIEKRVVTNLISVPEHTVDSQVHPEASVVAFDSVHQGSEAEEDQESEDDNDEDSVANYEGPLSIPSREILDDDSRDASQFQNDSYQNMSSYQPEADELEHHAVEDLGASVTSVTRNLQQLSVKNDERGLPSEGDAPSVVIPDHLQVQTADCSHLSFGSFGSGMNVAYSSGAASVPAKTKLEEPESKTNVSVLHPDTGNSEYYVDDSHRNATEGSLFHGTGASAGGYDASSASQPEDLKPNNAELSQGNQYSLPSSSHGYAFDESQHLSASLSQTSSEMLNLASFSNIMQSYPNALPSTLLAANVQPSRESEIQYSQFPVTQSMSTKYGNSSSIGGSAISVSEALNSAGFSSTQPAPQTLSGTGIANGPPLPQHLPVHPYSQPTLPLGPFTNMIGYPFLHQSYTYMPSAFQQAFAGNSTYHQSLAAVLPQYKNSVSLTSLPQSAAIASGYGALGNTTAIPGNLSLNPPAAPSGSTLSFDDLLNSHYKDPSHLISLQQNENQAMWLHGANSRSISSVPPSTYYNFQGQNQQPSGFRQGQQPSQNYGALGYPNIYHSQTGNVSLDQPQNPRDGSLGGSQVQPKPSQIWQNSY